MKEDYLWDRSGEPDPEIQQLEEILGTLRYQPRELEIPADLEVGRKRNFFRMFTPALAIAAAIALLLLGVGVWFALQRLQTSPRRELAKNPAIPTVSPNQSPANVKELVVNPDHRETPVEMPHASGDNQSVATTIKHRNRHTTVRSTVDESQLAANRQEAQAAKDQLFLALRLTSMKLNYAQRKTQGPNIKENQHRIG
ncbi:MAG TPA: hypothetical protein VLL54_13810 [Pyrinomonadaceae bacterium]|nr:hypothetical protein [Pyrinomonadaceae bacterium]